MFVGSASFLANTQLKDFSRITFNILTEMKRVPGGNLELKATLE